MKINRKDIKEYYFAAAVFCIFLSLLCPAALKNGASDGIKTAFGTIVPAVFPMLVLSSFAAKTPLPERLCKKLTPALNKLFGLSGKCTAAVLTGLCGGYNVSAKTACALYRDGKINLEEARRLAVFFTAPGLSFCINVTGTAILNSGISGIFLFISNTLACLLSAFIFAQIKKNNITSVYYENSKAPSFAEAAVYAVKTSSEAVISISAWITAFSAFAGVFSQLCQVKGIKLFVKLTGEITASVIFTTEKYPLFVTSACLFFGGWCVFLQQLPLLEELRVKPSFFLTVRAAGAAAAAGVQYILSKVFSFYIPTAAAHPEIKIFSHNIYGGTALFLLCGIFLAFCSDFRSPDIFRRKKS